MAEKSLLDFSDLGVYHDLKANLMAAQYLYLPITWRKLVKQRKSVY